MNDRQEEEMRHTGCQAGMAVRRSISLISRSVTCATRKRSSSRNVQQAVRSSTAQSQVKDYLPDWGPLHQATKDWTD